MPTIRISDETANVLKRMARPLEDTWDTYLSRAGRFLWMRRSEFASFEAGVSGDVDDTPAPPGERTEVNAQRARSHGDFSATVNGRTSGARDQDGRDAENTAHDDYARTEKITWVVKHMDTWISKREFLHQAEVAFPNTPLETLNGTIGQYWTDSTNAKYDAPFRRRGMRGEERQTQGVHEKRLVRL